MLSLVATVLAVRLVPTWPEMGSRYDAPGRASRSPRSTRPASRTSGRRSTRAATRPTPTRRSRRERRTRPTTLTPHRLARPEELHGPPRQHPGSLDGCRIGTRRVRRRRDRADGGQLADVLDRLSPSRRSRSSSCWSCRRWVSTPRRTAMDGPATAARDPAGQCGRRPPRAARADPVPAAAGPLLTGGLVGGATIALHFRDPHESGSWGYCPFNALTGLYCPGLRRPARGQRPDQRRPARRGQQQPGLRGADPADRAVVGALDQPRLERRPRRRRRGPARQRADRRLRRVLLVFGVLRNLPMGSWLAP